VLVDDDVNQLYENYYLGSLDTNVRNVRLWNRGSSALSELSGVPAVIWFTGNDDSTTLQQNDQLLLGNYIHDGGHLLLSGQNIVDNWRVTTDFLDTVLHCAPHTYNVNFRHLRGVSGDPITDSLDVLLTGPEGANNQTSPSSIQAEPGSTEIFHYANTSAEACGVSGTYGDGSYIFVSFGLEAVAGFSGTTPRDVVLTRCLTWFIDTTATTHEPQAELPTRAWLAQNFPNPFNPTTTLRFFAPLSDTKVTLTLYNLLGQEVQRLYDGHGTGSEVTANWNGLSKSGMPAASGVYLVRLESGSSDIVHKLQLLR
jgi:hypothetical protein